MNFLDAAFDLTRFGYKVFPLQSGGKKPAISGVGGCNSATDDEDQIAEWSEKYPSANIGIRCGVESGITVVDIDVKDAAGGDVSLKKLRASGLTLPKTVTVQTPSGGVHFYFAFNPEIANSVSAVGKGIDIRSQNGYVVAPPSSMAGGATYQWKRRPLGSALPQLPQWLMEKAKPKTAPFVPHKPMTQRTAHDGLERQCDKLRAAIKGTRNVTLYNTALYAKHRSDEGLITASEARARVADAAYSIGLPKPEVDATLASAWRDQS